MDTCLISNYFLYFRADEGQRAESVKSHFCFRSHLLHRGVVEEDPFGGLGVEGEGTVVAAGVADHPHELQLRLFGEFIRHPVEELNIHTSYWPMEQPVG